MVLVLAGPFVLPALGVESLTAGTPGTLTYLFSFIDTPTELSMGVGPGVLGLGALFGLRYALIRSYVRAARP